MKPSRIVRVGGLLAVLLLSNPTLTRGVDQAPYLSAEDVTQEREDRQRGPALSSALNDPNPWQTYNQWMCFDRDVVKVKDIQIRFKNTWNSWPQITVENLGQTFGFSPETDLPIDAESVKNRWNELLLKSSWVCVYSAFLQYLDLEGSDSKEPYSIWVIERVKTEQGYWNVSESIDGYQNTADQRENPDRVQEQT